MESDDMNVSLVSVLCPVCGCENEADPSREQFFCCACGKQVITKAALAFTVDGLKHRRDDRPVPVIDSEETLDRSVKRAWILLEDGNEERALSFCESILDYDPECVDAFLIRLLAGLHLRSLEELASCRVDFRGIRDYKRACEYADSTLAETLQAVADEVAERANETYEQAMFLLLSSSGPEGYRKAAALFATIGDYADARMRQKEALNTATKLEKEAQFKAVQNEETYRRANRMMQGEVPGGLGEAARLFASLGSWRDSPEMARECRRRLEEGWTP